MNLGLENFLNQKAGASAWPQDRVGLVAHPASVNQDLVHTSDLLAAQDGLNLVCAFGPQHGMRGEKQDNMIESEDFIDPQLKIPVFSLYGEHRRLTPEMLEKFDTLIIDLQDVGCRIYTFLTTLFYLMEDCALAKKRLIVFDRPNPAGRKIEGSCLNMAYSSFVGAAPLPMRHGLTLGEAALWYKDKAKLDLQLEVCKMSGYDPGDPKDRGWPSQLSWVNPSPNMPRLSCVRQYPGTVLLEGTHISEGRGTTTPLEVFGFPGMKSASILQKMNELAPEWVNGCRLRSCFFEPTFHKFQGELVSAIQIHIDGAHFQPESFRPYRLVSLFLKAVRLIHPEFEIWKQPPYEYETEKLPIEILSGDARLREWVDDRLSSPYDFDSILAGDEASWLNEIQSHLLYA